MPKALLSPKCAISCCLITGYGSQTFMKASFEFGAMLIQPHSLQFGTGMAGISSWQGAWAEHRLVLFCTVTHAYLFFPTSVQTAHP